MALENIVRNYYLHLCNGNCDAIAELVDQGIVHEFNQGPTHIGIEKFREFLNVKEKHYKETIQDLFIFVDLSAHRAAAEFLLKGNYVQTYPGLPAATGQSYKIRVGAFFEFRNNKISRLTTYFNFESWLSQISIGSQ